MKELTTQEEYMLLAVYRLKDNAYLISIREYLESFTGKSMRIGSIFSPLDRMRRSGLLRTVTGEPSSKVGGRAIKYYFLTEEGLKSLSERRKLQEKMWTGFSESDYKLINE